MCFFVTLEPLIEVFSTMIFIDSSLVCVFLFRARTMILICFGTTLWQIVSKKILVWLFGISLHWILCLKRQHCSPLHLVFSAKLGSMQFHSDFACVENNLEDQPDGSDNFSWCGMTTWILGTPQAEWNFPKAGADLASSDLSWEKLWSQQNHILVELKGWTLQA